MPWRGKVRPGKTGIKLDRALEERNSTRIVCLSVVKVNPDAESFEGRQEAVVVCSSGVLNLAMEPDDSPSF